MRLEDFYYELPEELIAQEPLSQRSMSKLMVLDRARGRVEHKKFKDIVNYLEAGDCLILNDTRVIPARLLGKRKDTGGKIEFVLLKRRKDNIWEVILKPGRKAKPGSKFVFGDGILEAEILEIIEDGNRLVRFRFEGVFEQILDKIGIMPLPPYITREMEDYERYQTVYSRSKGSSAAPTAGLHFTDELLESIRRKNISVVFITLHIGLGTFRPVKVKNIEEHRMHSEYFCINENTCKVINETRKRGGRIIAVGTTSTRVLETVGNENGFVNPKEGYTDIFIYPGYKFKVVDALITNFHLPGSTLIILVSAFAGRENIMEAYKIAIKEKYRFFSFGDSMLIL